MSEQDGGGVVVEREVDVDTSPDKENALPRGGRVSTATFGRRSIGGRRRSSGIGFGRRVSGLGGGTPVDSAEQAKLADMYSQIIKLSSENKINAKNSWSLNLIEHMDRMILGEEGARSRVNFQKASCTLDASIKIYSYRVDETAASTYRVLENLHRTGGDAPHADASGSDEEIGNGSDGGKDDGGRRRGARSRAATKLCLSDTLEKNAAALNVSELDREFDVDPLFRKMSKTFDEAGSRGMLLLNLGVSNGCSVTFDSSGDADEPQPGDATPESSQPQQQEGGCGSDGGAADEGAEEGAAAAPAPVDVTALRARLLQMCSDLFSVPLCPQFEDLRSELCRLGEPVAPPDAASPPLTQHQLQQQSLGAPSPAAAPWGDSAPQGATAAVSVAAGDDNGYDYGGGGYDGGGSDGGFDGGDGGGDGASGPRTSVGSVFAPDAEVHWGDAATTGGRRVSTSVASRAPLLMDRLCKDVKMVDDEYAYFDRAALAAANQWAGHTHWKFAAPRGASQKSAAAAVEGEGRSAGSKRARKAAFTIDFNALPMPASTFAAAKKKRGTGKSTKQQPAPQADATQLSAATLARAAAAAEAGALTLPKDLHFRARDLARLFLRPAAVARSRAAGAEEETAAARGGGGGGLGFVDCAGDGGAGAAAFNVDGIDFAGSGSAHGHGDYGDDYSDDGGGGGGFDYEGPAYGDGVGLIDDDFKADGLLKADRVVEKLEVKHATRAKKVDVRRLKRDLWQHIDGVVARDDAAAASVPAAQSQSPPDAAEQEPPAADVPVKADQVCFSSVVDEVAAKEEQSGVTVSYYFICLLHLANEKGLRLEGREDLADFEIFSDSAGGHPV